MTLTKADIAEDIHQNCDVTKAYAANLAEFVFETIKATLERGEDVLISGFGKFEVKEKNSRRGRNPATGNDLILDARRVVTFKCSAILKEKMNGKGGKGK